MCAHAVGMVSPHFSSEQSLDGYGGQSVAQVEAPYTSLKQSIRRVPPIFLFPPLPQGAADVSAELSLGLQLLRYFQGLLLKPFLVKV